MNNYINDTNMIKLGITCDNCGKTTQGATYVNGMYFCAKCYQETYGKSQTAEFCDMLHKEIYELIYKKVEDETKVLKKALELAVNCLQREIDGDYIKATEVLAIYEIGKDYFIEQAKESLK